MRRGSILSHRNFVTGLMLTAILTVLLLPSSALAWDPGVITTFAGTGESPGYSGDGGAAMAAQLDSPHGISLDDEGNLFIADRANNCVRMVPVESGTYYNIVMTGGCIYTIAGDGTVGFSGDGGAATSAQLHWPHGVTVDSLGNVYIADTYNHRIRKVDTSGIITTFGGTGTGGYLGDGGPATSARLNEPMGLACDTSDNLYIADYFNHRIRMVAATSAQFYGQDMTAGYIYTIAGTGVWDYSGEGGVPTDAQLGRPIGVHVDSDGNLFIADSENRIVRMIPATGGTHYGQEDMIAGCIYTIAGTPESQGFSGDGGQATSAQLTTPHDMVVNSEGVLLIVDCGNNRVRKVDADGYISTYAGTGVGDYSGDDGPATEARIGNPSGIDVDTAGNTYFSESYTDVIRKVAPAGALQTISLDLEIGWNLVSVPVQADDMACDAVFDPEKVDGVYLWDPENHEYYVPVIIDPAYAYWVASSSVQTIEVTGTPVTEWTYTAYEGWNMIGSLYGDTVAASCLTTTADPDPLQRDDFYCWDVVDGEFDPVTEIAQGVGYFLASAGECDLRLAPPSE